LTFIYEVKKGSPLDDLVSG